MSSDPLLPPDSDPRPLPPAGGPVTPLGVGSAQATTTGLAPNLGAGLSMLIPLIGGIIFLIAEKRNQFIRFWAMQSVFFFAAWTIFWIAAFIVGIVFGHIPGIRWLWFMFCWLVQLGFMIGWLALIILAFIGSNWEIPVLGKMAREQLAKMPVV